MHPRIFCLNIPLMTRLLPEARPSGAMRKWQTAHWFALRKFEKPPSIAFKDQFDDLDDALADVGRRLAEAKNDTSISSYEQGYLDNPVSRLLSVTAGFKQYLQLLIPPKPDELLPAIMKQFKQTNDQIGENSSRIDDLKQLTAREVKQVKDSLDTLDRKMDTMIGLLRAGVSGKQYVLAGGYADNVFGTAYLHRVTKSDYLGAELVFPVLSEHVPDAGAFLCYALRDNKLLPQAGLGYLKNTKTREDVSWKAGILYTPLRAGIGLSYSPLTGAGITLAYRW